MTESQRLLRERQISEERFSKVFETNPVAIFITRRKDRQLLDINAEFVRQSGYSREEIIGRSSQDLGFWTQQEDRELAWSMLDGRHPLQNLEVTFQRKNGTELYGVLSIVPLDVAGEACVIGFVRDITDERRAQRELKDSEQRYRQLATELKNTLDLSLDLIATVGPDQRILTINAACSRLLGYVPEEMIGRSVRDFIHPDDRTATATAGRSVRSGEATLSFQNRYVHRDGSVVWLEWSAVVLPDDPVMYCVGRDVTQRRAAEEDQAFLAAIVQTSHNSIIGVSLDDTIRSWNPAAEALYGYTAEEAIGQAMSLLVPPELQDEESAHLRAGGAG